MFPSITVLGLKETQDDRAVSPLKCVVRKFLTACLSVGSKKKKKKPMHYPVIVLLDPILGEQKCTVTQKPVRKCL